MNLRWLFIINMVWDIIMVTVCLIDKLVNNASYDELYTYLILLNMWIIGSILYSEIRRKR